MKIIYSPESSRCLRPNMWAQLSSKAFNRDFNSWMSGAAAFSPASLTVAAAVMDSGAVPACTVRYYDHLAAHLCFPSNWKSIALRSDLWINEAPTNNSPPTLYWWLAVVDIIVLAHYNSTSRGPLTRFYVDLKTVFGVPLTAGDNAKKVQGGGCCGPCCVYFITSACCAQGCYAMGIRQDIRQRGALQGSGGKACLAHTFCSACATCQDAREIKRQTAMGIPTNSQFIATAAPSQQVIMK